MVYGADGSPIMRAFCKHGNAFGGAGCMLGAMGIVFAKRTARGEGKKGIRSIFSNRKSVEGRMDDHPFLGTPGGSVAGSR